MNCLRYKLRFNYFLWFPKKLGGSIVTTARHHISIKICTETHCDIFVSSYSTSQPHSTALGSMRTVSVTMSPPQGLILDSRFLRAKPC